MNNLHDLLANVKGVLVKDFTPKYNTIELCELKETYPFSHIVGLLPFKKAKKYFGNRKILSVMDFNDTHITLIIIEEGEQEEN